MEEIPSFTLGDCYNNTGVMGMVEVQTKQRSDSST